jgi:hypothetical protein
MQGQEGTAPSTHPPPPFSRKGHHPHEAEELVVGAVEEGRCLPQLLLGLGALELVAEDVVDVLVDLCASVCVRPGGGGCTGVRGQDPMHAPVQATLYPRPYMSTGIGGIPVGEGGVRDGLGRRGREEGELGKVLARLEGCVEQQRRPLPSSSVAGKGSVS